MRERITTRDNAKDAVRKNAENSPDWEYRDDAVFLYALAIRFRSELIDPIARLDRNQMPDPVISFDDARNNNVLASYTLGRNSVGLLDEITFNTAHYVDGVWEYGRWSQCETLVHEQTHLFLENLTKVDGKKRPVHGKEFVKRCESYGLHVRPNRGSHFQVADADSPFGRIMNELGIPRPDDVPRADPKFDWFRLVKPKGTSTLSKWVCPDCEFKARVGVKDDPELYHKHGEQFIKFVQGDVYKAK